jgi:diacylglycerol kinase (ATP)
LACEVLEVSSVEAVADRLATMEEDVVPVSAGGDGTLNMVTQAIRVTGVSVPRLGLFPLGTANLLARELGIRSRRLAFRALTGEAVRGVDVMETDHPDAPIALVSFSGGFEAEFIHRYARGRRHGRVLGAWSGVTALARRGASVDLELDGETVAGASDGAFAVGLYNTSHYPGDVLMMPEGDPSDGRGEAVIYRSARAYLGMVARGALRRGTSPKRGVWRRTWTTARVSTEGVLQVDGEAVPGGDVHLKLVPAALNVLVPPARG